MGSTRIRPKRLAEKLLAIRNRLDGGLSQTQLIYRLKLENEIGQERISKYERDIIEPPLHILCAYADAAGIYLELLVKDELELPAKLPGQKLLKF